MRWCGWVNSVGGPVWHRSDVSVVHDSVSQIPTTEKQASMVLGQMAQDQADGRQRLEAVVASAGAKVAEGDPLGVPLGARERAGVPQFF